MISLRVLIVDDEPLIRTGIHRVLSGIDGIEIAGECGSGLEAITAIASQQPDVVLLDVQMPDCSGLEVVRQVGPAQMPAVIFVTAHDEYAVRAFELNAVDYLLKPFSDERLREGIGRARVRLESQTRATLTRQLEALLDTERPAAPQTLVVRNGERFDFVPVDSIDWIESANNYVQLHCGARSYIMAETLSGLERRLDRHLFLRIHRCRIVNISRIVAAHTTFGGAYELELRSGVRLATGRQHKGVVQQLLKGSQPAEKS
jgi:two-component system, LytTR family, response regulator